MICLIFERRANPLEEIRSPLFVQPQNAATPPESSGPNREYFLPYQRIPIPVHSMGPDGLLLEVNEAWVDYTGYSKAQVIGRSALPTSSIRPIRVAVSSEGCAGADRHGAHHGKPIRRIPHDQGLGGRLPTSFSPHVLNGNPMTGRFLHSLTVINDITARNRAEARLRQAQKLEALGSLTSGVAHDFNNLLMIILGSLQLLARRLPADDARAGRLVDAAMQGATRGAALTTRLLAFARQQELSSAAGRSAG